MDQNTSTDVSAESSSAASESTSSQSEVSSQSTKSFKEAAIEYADTQEAARQSLEKPKSDLDKSDEKAGDTPESKEKSDTRQSEKKNNSKLEARFGKLTSELKQERLEKAKLIEAVKILDQQLKRVLPNAKLDPHEEALEELKLKHRLEAFEREMPAKFEQEFAEQMRLQQESEQVESIVDEMALLVKENENLFSLGELSNYMRRTGTLDPSIAAKKLVQERLSVAAKKLKPPPAPATTASRPSNSRELSQPFKYEGSKTILNYLDEAESLRSGKTK